MLALQLILDILIGAHTPGLFQYESYRASMTLH